MKKTPPFLLLAACLALAAPARAHLDTAGTFAGQATGSSVAGVAVAAPLVIVQPPVAQNAVAGQSVTLTVTATSSFSLSYQWRRAGLNLIGATAAALTLSPVQVSDAGNYDVVVSTTAGSVTSAVATLAVVAEPTYSFTTFAGDLGVGSADGPGADARFDSPCDAIGDANGNVYVTDTANHTIRKITAAGVVSTFAGLAGQPGTANGTGGAARFNSPLSLALDAAGNLYVADTANHAIRKVSPAGVVTTLAGWPGTGGSGDGVGESARFNSPSGIALDASGNVFVGDTNSCTIRKISPTGIVSTLAGTAFTPGSADGAGSSARFHLPRGLVVDAAGNIFVADSQNHTIRKITAAGLVTTLAGTAGSSGANNGTGSAAQFSLPSDVALGTGGEIFVVDIFHTVRRITAAGSVSNFAGTSFSAGNRDGVGTAARFDVPFGIGSDPSGSFFVADRNNNLVRKITPGAVVTTLAGSSGYGSADGSGRAARFDNPRGVTTDAVGNVYVADTLNHTVRKITSAGAVTTVAGLSGVLGSTDATGSAARFSYPYGVAADPSGNLYIANDGGRTVRKISSAAVVTTLAGSPLSGGGTVDGIGSLARFESPEATAVDAAGNVYVADGTAHTVRKISPSGVVTTLAGLGGFSGTADGTGSAARFQYPGGVAVDAGGNVYVADTGNHTIRKITPSGVVTTFAGYPTSYGSGDGPRLAARFFYPRGVAIGHGGDIYVADSANSTIRRISAAGAVVTIGGNAAVLFGSSDGIAGAARFSFPYALTVDFAGTLYIADSQNSLIRKGVLVFTPLLATQPQSQSVSAGTDFSLSVTTAASALSATYQWRKDGVGIAGATSATYSITGFQAAAAGSYTVAVTNALGTAISAPAVLAIDIPLAITTQPANTTVTSGQSATFSVTAVGNAPLSYQWRRGGFPISGATAANFTMPAARRSDADFYDVVVSNPSGSLTATTVSLSVAPTQTPDVLVPEPALAPRIESTDLAGFNAWLELPDGRLLVGGNFTGIGATPRTYLARLTAAGALDATFVPPLLDGAVTVLMRQSDGRILVGGQFTGQLLRLNADGPLDATFSVGQGFDASGLTGGLIGGVRTLAVQSDGKILVGGNFTHFQGVARKYLLRLTSDGSLDSGFTPAAAITNGGELVRGVVRTIHVQADGAIVVGGTFAKRLARLTPAGALDATFDANLGSGFSSHVYVVRGTGGSKLWIAGEFSTLNSVSRPRVARLNSDGTADTFVVAGSLSGYIRHLSEQSDGRVLVGGEYLKPTRLGLDGAVDGTVLYPASSIAATGALQMRGDGSVFVGVSLASSGNADTDYQPAFYSLTNSTSSALVPVVARAPGTVNQMALAAGGKIYFAGDFTHVNGVARQGLVRLTADSALDPTFDAGFLGGVSRFAVQGDGRLLVNRNSFLQRLNADGSSDPSFVPNASPGVLKLDALGRAVVSRYNVALGQNVIERLTPSGTVDATFTAASTGSQPPSVLGLQSDGKILVGGPSLTTIAGAAFTGLARLTATGALDPTFTFSAPAGNTLAIDRVALVQLDGRILGGRGDTGSGTTTLLRLGAGGTVDPSFNAYFSPQPSPSIMPHTLGVVVLPDGRIVRGGGSTSSGGPTFSRHADNGARDTTFQAFTPANLVAYSFDLLDDGRVVAATSRGLQFFVPGAAPTISVPPANVFATLGGSATLGVTATGGGLSYQWRFNDTPIPGATNATLALTNLTAAAGGSYTVKITNPIGTVTSSVAFVSTDTRLTAPIPSRSVGFGGATTFTAAVVAATPITYQWRKNGADLAGATTASLALPVVSVSDAGSYAVAVRSPSGDLTSAPAVLTVLPNPLSYSARPFVGRSGATAYFAIEGSAPKALLVRALGPTLTGLGVSGALADPLLTLRDASGNVIAANDDWGNATGVDFPALFNQLGATALPAGGKDAALFATLAPGAYTLSLVGVGGTTGIALLELFDTDTNPVSHLAYFSVRSRVDPTLGGLVAGFGPTSAAEKRILVRAIGPTLGGSTALMNPRLQVLQGSTPFATNDDWGGGAPLLGAAAQAGAFPLPSASADAALLLNARLAAAAYVAQIPASSAGGDALLELYDLNAAGVPTFAPLVVVPPLSQSLAVGAPLVLRALVAGGGAISYQWRKNSIALSGATAATFALSSVQPADAGNYDVIVNAPPMSATSPVATITVLPKNPAGYSATHAVVGAGYVAGGTVTLTQTLTYAGPAASLGWTLVLPTGWSFAAQNDDAGSIKPVAGATGTLGWVWTSPPSSPVTFTCTLHVPAGEIDAVPLAASAVVRDGVGNSVTLMTSPTPLVVSPAATHSADTDHNFRFSLVELTRVIELFNTRLGTVRTGCYRVQSGTEDGFASDTETLPTADLVRRRYHSVDADRDGAVGLFELTRIIELYNTRAGTTRTGAYHPQPNTEDGFAPGS